MYLLK